MLANLPTWIRFSVLLCSGAIVGALINGAIYVWAMFLTRPVSPWMKPAEGESERTWLDRVPIIGWINRRRDSKIHGRGFWIRPMLIEIVWAIGLPWFYQWLANGGLTVGLAGAVPPPTAWAETWFLSLGILTALMCIGTFIDFDEKTIPDEVTVTGTIIALLLAAFAPWSRLPEVVAGIAGPVIQSIHFASPHPPGNFHLGTWGLVTALAIFAVWIWALLPKLPVWYVGLGKSCRFMLAHAIQPKRKTKCEIRTQPRQTPRFTIFLATLLVVGLAAIALAWNSLPAVNLESLFGSLVGLAFGGGLVWAVRIIGTLALRQEAMGFGDVTLMAMIGAFLGWQAALLVFVIAPFAALLIVIFQFILTRQNEIAFGPYLCAAAVILLYSWNWLWPGAAMGVFSLMPILIYILMGALVLMAVMLAVLQWIKAFFRREELEP
jgi:leader peptidase (prepilin peptidase)/N-methyltransferase